MWKSFGFHLFTESREFPCVLYSIKQISKDLYHHFPFPILRKTPYRTVISKLFVTPFFSVTVTVVVPVPTAVMCSL